MELRSSPAMARGGGETKLGLSFCMNQAKERARMIRGGTGGGGKRTKRGYLQHPWTVEGKEAMSGSTVLKKKVRGGEGEGGNGGEEGVRRGNSNASNV